MPPAGPTSAPRGAVRRAAPPPFRPLDRPSTCGFTGRRRRRLGRPGGPESRQWAAVTPGARDHGFVAACRACRSARSNARPTPQFGPHTGPDGARRGLEAAWWPRIRPCGHHRRLRRAPGPGAAALGGLAQVTRASSSNRRNGRWDSSAQSPAPRAAASRRTEVRPRAAARAPGPDQPGPDQGLRA